MDHQKPQKATKNQKIKLFSTLLSLLPELKTCDRQAAQLILVRIFYLIFGFENKVIDKKGVVYSVFDKKELMSLFTAASDHLETKRSLFNNYPDYLPQEHSAADDIEASIKVFDKLKKLGFDFKYVGRSQQKMIDISDLERADRLIDALKRLFDEDQSKGNFAEEQMLLNNIDLTKIQEEIREQMLHSKVGELAPDKILIAYYKVYQKLPLSYTVS